MAETDTQEESPSAGDTLAGAAKDLPLALPVSKAVKSAGEGDYGSVASDVANFAMGAQSILEDPLNALITAGLGFLLDVVQPLKDALQLVTGNPEALDEGASDFSEIGKDIGNLGNELTEITESGFANWSGDAKTAASAQVQNYFNGVEQTAQTAGNVMMMLQLSSTLMEAAYNFIKGIIAQCIEWLIVTWVAALAATVFTFGASDAAATAATGVEVATESANAADKVEEATSLVEKIVNVLKKLMQDIKDIQKAWKDLKDVKEVGTAAKDGEKAAKDAETVAKDGEKAAKDGETAAKDGEKAEQDAAKSNPIKDKANELKDKFGDQLHNSETAHQGLGSYLTTGTEHGIGGVAKDVGKETLSNTLGDMGNRIVYGAQTAPNGQPQESDDGTETMSGSLTD
jgi:uncharacterized protein YukE